MEALQLATGWWPIGVLGILIGMLVLLLAFALFFVQRHFVLPVSMAMALILGLTQITTFMRETQGPPSAVGSPLFAFLFFAAISILLLASAARLSRTTRGSEDTGDSLVQILMLGSFLAGAIIAIALDPLPSNDEASQWIGRTSAVTSPVADLPELADHRSA